VEHTEEWRTFARVAREGSFTAAARGLGLTKGVVSARVAALEARVGVRLLERTTRAVRVTQAGESALVACAELDRALEALETSVEEHRVAPVGTLRVTATHDLAARLVLPAVGDVAAAHAGLRVEVVADDAPRDLVGEGFDVAVRLGTPSDSGLAMRKLGSFEEPMVASPALADALGRPAHPGALGGAPGVRHAVAHRTGAWTLRSGDEAVPVALSFRGTANTGDGVRALALAGVGVTCLPAYLVADDLRAGNLVRLCPGWSLATLTLFALFTGGRRPPRRVALLLAALQERLVGLGALTPP